MRSEHHFILGGVSPMSILAEILESYRIASHAMHQQWSAQVGKPDYDKATWMKMSNALDKLARDAATLAGHPRSEPII